MPSVNSLEELIKKTKEEAMKILKENVSNVVIETEKEHAKNDVYDVYSPKQYDRIYSLYKDDNYKVNVGEDNITIKNISEHEGKNVPYVVETGQGYDYTGYGYAYEKPRPFIEKTKQEIKENNIHIKTMKEELKKKGFNVK